MLNIKQGLRNLKEDYVDGSHWVLKAVGTVLLAYALMASVLGFYWNSEPDVSQPPSAQTVIGEATTKALLHLANTLLDKPGGYLSNDVSLPGVWMDNIPNWEYGVLIQVRDLSRAMRKDFSRSQSQSTEDMDLAVAEPQFNFDSESCRQVKESIARVLMRSRVIWTGYLMASKVRHSFMPGQII